MRDSRDFDSFYLGTAPRVTSHVHAMVGNRADAEDVTQEAYARAWQHWDKVARYDSPEAWVRTIAFRIAVSTWRKARNRLTAHRRHGVPEDLPGADPDYVAIVAALRRIAPDQRRAVVLYHLVGLSVPEIAAETGVAVGTVRARLTRGRQALAPHLSEFAAELTAGVSEVANHG
ncbi:RNA polymerase sigma factor [Actinocatenispora comari]|uniref:RNA polymerase sigma24 factor n=1 Tax=Actinocatenispora comari TaxID=2807577 RepID=A0A8J4AKY2_9ACTN|nr:SigE family RNA polymerase sigma factor [Actinocatenispora comari]GIL30648.1 RNA polymerase sigma24 factor [Actinocatenispora comari]